MPFRHTLQKLSRHEGLNFLLTNRLPRHASTVFIGWFSKIEQPWICAASIAVWKYFSGLDLSEARKTSFKSMHECFIRELKPGARPVDERADILTSPCDAIVGAHGTVAGITALQVKGFPYSLSELLGNERDSERFRDGTYVTLRLTSAMYHRFHAPQDCTVERVDYISGDTWNVNPVALKRIERLYCKNERAVLWTRLRDNGQSIAIVPVAAILVASIRLHFLDVLLHVNYSGAKSFATQATFRKGQEMGWFQHGSTIIVFAPKGFVLDEHLHEGSIVRMGEALMHLPPVIASSSPAPGPASESFRPAA